MQYVADRMVNCVKKKLQLNKIILIMYLNSIIMTVEVTYKFLTILYLDLIFVR